MPSRQCGGSRSRAVRRKNSLGNLRRAHPASGATWNVQVVRSKMSSKCLWHACRALVLGLTLLILGAGMATIGYYADYLSESSELRGNATIRIKNDLRGFHLNNLSYVGPIVMGFGGFIIVASCVMTFEARDSAAKVVPARLRVTSNGKTIMHSNPSSSGSQKKTTGVQLQPNLGDQNFGVFRPTPVAKTQPVTATPLDREALTAELIKFSKFFSATARFSPQLQHHILTGSVPNISTFAYSTNISNLLSPHYKSLLLREQKRYSRQLQHHHSHYNQIHQYHECCRLKSTINPNSTKNNTNAKNNSNINSGRQLKCHDAHVGTNLIQRKTRKCTSSMVCGLLPSPHGFNKLYLHPASFSDTAPLGKQLQKKAEYAKTSNTSKKHVLARQKPIEQQEENKILLNSLDTRRSSIMSDSSHSSRWATRAVSIASRASSIDSHHIQVDLHSPEVIHKPILYSPKRYNSGPFGTYFIEKEFRSQLSVCSEPPTTLDPSRLKPCLLEETTDILIDECGQTVSEKNKDLISIPFKENKDNKKLQLNALPLITTATVVNSVPKHDIHNTTPLTSSRSHSVLKNCHSSPTCHDQQKITKRMLQEDEAIKNRGSSQDSVHELFDSEQVINERRSTLLKASHEIALTERDSGNLSMPKHI